MKKSLTDMLNSISGKEEAPEPANSGAYVLTDSGEMAIDHSKLQNKHIFFATPCYGGMATDQFFTSMFKSFTVLQKAGISYSVTTIRNESLVPRARNMLTAMFLESQATHLMFIDADIEFPEDAVLKLLAHDRDLVVGAYPKKTLPVQYAINFKFKDMATKTLHIENNLAELWDASTGFFMIKREVIERMIVEFPELRYRNDTGSDASLDKHCYALFDTAIDEKDARYLSEDYYFCRNWQKLGGKIWLDLTIKLNHVGSYTFPGDIQSMLNGVRLK